MSIYSGFATRNLENSYNRYLCEAIYLLQKFVVSCLNNHKIDTFIFCDNFSKAYYKLSCVETQKNLIPKFSDCMKELNCYIQSISNKRTNKFLENLEFNDESVRYLARSKLDRRKELKTSMNTSQGSSRTRETRTPRLVQKQKMRIKTYQDEILKKILNDLSAYTLFIKYIIIHG
jgi:hypothetical protein